MNINLTFGVDREKYLINYLLFVNVYFVNSRILTIRFSVCSDTDIEWHWSWSFRDVGEYHYCSSA